MVQDTTKNSLPTPTGTVDTGLDVDITKSGTMEELVLADDDSDDMTSNDDSIHAALDRRLLWKIDLLILPFLTIIQFLFQMDHTDVSNAKVAGMGKDLKLTAADFSNIGSIFPVGYILFMPAGTLLLRLLTPPIQLGGAMLLWGAITLIHVAAKNYPELLALRFFVGAAEGMGQGTVLFLTFWYTSREIGARGAIFHSVSSLAGAFNGIISYSIAKTLNGKNGWAAWQWIFFVEGLLPVGFAFLTFFLLPAVPEKAKFGFSKEERKRLVARTRKAGNTEDAKLRPKLILVTFKDPKVWLLALAYTGGLFAFSSMQNFTPSIIEGLGYSSNTAQLMSSIVSACGFVTTIAWGFLTDRYNLRGIPMMISTAVMLIGYIILVTTNGLKARFAATCLVGAGAYPISLLLLIWLIVNVVGFTKRSTALAFVNIAGQLGGIAGNQAYRDPPLYRKGHIGAIVAVSVTLGTCGVLYFYLKRANEVKRRNQGSEQAARERLVSLDVIGDAHPDFFFTL